MTGIVLAWILLVLAGQEQRFNFWDKQQDQVVKVIFALSFVCTRNSQNWYDKSSFFCSKKPKGCSTLGHCFYRRRETHPPLAEHQLRALCNARLGGQASTGLAQGLNGAVCFWAYVWFK